MFIKRLLRNLSWRRRPSSDHLRLGAAGERAASRFLKRHRYRILGRNFRCNAGEIDIITRRGDLVVFIEVKTRSDDHQTDKLPVHPSQQDRIGRAARFFLAKARLEDRPVRFDVVYISWPQGSEPLIEHVEDAFVPGAW